MNNLDDLSKIKILDKKNALDSINQLPLQIQQAWQESNSLEFPQTYKETKNIVICGMGGSTYGTRIIKSLYDSAAMTKIPIELANNYWLPGYVGENSLVILSSYSGDTQETLSTAKEAKEKGAKIIGLTSGGELATFLNSNNYTSYIFNPIHNPSAQPRIGAGYMVMGLIGMLAKLGIIPVGSDEVEKIIEFLQNQNSLFNENVTLNNNTAKQMAVNLENKIPVIIVADFLEGAAYAIRNPFHETAKQFALYFAIPELNHHLMEGLTFPNELKSLLQFIFIRSTMYDKRNIKRMTLTQEIIKNNNIPSETITLSGYSALTQVFEFTQWGSWVTFYLAMLHGIDPSEIPWVDYFKKNLSAKG